MNSKLRKIKLSIKILLSLVVGAHQFAQADDFVTHHLNMAMENPNTPLKVCKSAGMLTSNNMNLLSNPFNDQESFTQLSSSDIWKNVIANLWVNRDQAVPCFGMSDTSYWTKAVSVIPADIIGLQITEDKQNVFLYTSGIPDYLIRTPGHFISFTPGNIYAIYKISAIPTPDTAPVHEFSDAGAIGIFVNGSSIFNYTDTFSYNNSYAWVYDANVAEAFIVNSDIAHATPSNIPLFPKSRGIFHNHQMSKNFLEELQDPFATGKLAHSKVVGYAIDSTPIYGPLGYTSEDRSSGLKVLKSSYLKRDWLTAQQKGSGHRSALPEWAVDNWDGSNETAKNLVNLFQKPKSDMLYKDKASSGAIRYTGDDKKLANEIEFYKQHGGLYRDKLGYVYWVNEVRKPNGDEVKLRNYLLKSSKLWGPDFDAEVLPVSYQIADKDIFYFKAVVGTFAEDYEYVAGYGDLDFYNGIKSYVPEQGVSFYHYVTGYNAKLSDTDRLSKAQFPYVVGIQYKNKVDPFNEKMSDAVKVKYFADSGNRLTTIYDFGIIGKESGGAVQRGSVITTWQHMLEGGEKLSCH